MPESMLTSPSETLSASVNNSDNNLHQNDGNESEEDAPKRIRRRIQQFSDSDSDKEVLQNSEVTTQEESKLQESSNSNDPVIPKVQKKSRIRKASNKSSSDSDASNAGKKSNLREKPQGSPQSDCESDEAIFKSVPQSHTQLPSDESSDSNAVKYGQHMRMKNKRNKMKDKFKSLISSRGKEQPSDKPERVNMSSSESDDEAASIEKIKQKIKEKMSYKPSICDPDTSDEEAGTRQKSMPNQKMDKRTKMISPKPQRMSAKQAMENMQKIKSESNRMLREKEVSLPYHRPKALSLKDIMSRRKPAISSDGKCLPIKMNGDQLKQYAQMLQDRQKQMMELWQSESDEENDDKKSDDEKPLESATDDKKPEKDTNTELKVGSVVLSVDATESDVSEVSKEINLAKADISAANDELFDVLSESIIGNKANDSKEKENNHLESTDDKVTEEQDSETNLKLVFNDSETSITEKQDANNIPEDSMVMPNCDEISVIEAEKNIDNQALESAKPNTESDSQLVSLHYDSEKLDTIDTTEVKPKINHKNDIDKTDDVVENIDKEIEEMDVDGFSDDDMNIEDIDNIIENAEVIRDIEDKVNSQVLIRDRPLNLNPKLTGSPGMVIDLEDNDTLPKKSGVQLLKDRFTFFAKLKTPEELERAKERQIKPGHQHLKLKQALEEQMAEQRSLEWLKRLEAEKQQQKELKELRGEESDDETDLDKIEAKLMDDENIANGAELSDSEEEELLENDIDMKDKPRTKNPMLENEAEESDCEDEVKGQDLDDDGNEENAVNDGDDEDEDSESSESEVEQTSTKKGRILKAFEDSDEEENETETKTESKGCDNLLGSQLTSQDDVLTLAQRHKSVSEDIFTSQGSSLLASQIAKSPVPESFENDVDLGTQTFSILDSSKNTTKLMNAGLGSSAKINDICGTQTYVDNLDAAAAMCSGSFSQSLPPLPISQFSQSQAIGEDLLALCTGKFYENEFVSQVVDNQTPLGASQEFDVLNESPIQMSHIDKTQETPLILESQPDEENEINKENVPDIEVNTVSKVTQTRIVDDDNLKYILGELDDPDFDAPKPNKFFVGATQKQIEKEKEQAVIKKKLIIDSDDDNDDASETKKRKKMKKKKPEMRALQISDDEEDEVEEELEEYESEIEEENEERIVEYDSEENEIEVQPQTINLNQKTKKKRKGTEFFEQEAELTSEDEWAGSGDEDEAGLDRMEREAGDDENFHQGKLQRELGQIHMREVIDQDKREVRIIQELLFEDGDLGAGGRQRKFKWKNLDGDDETDTGNEELKDTQDEEFESEEQWRKQRHERETFLRQLQNDGELNDSLNVSINRTTIIKANLMSKTMSTLIAENQPADKIFPIETEKKTKDIPSPKKPFSILQQTYQGSILNRGRGALARLAALATPLASDDDAPKGKSAVTSSARNFVFATLTPEAPKVSKRKADVNPGTPALVKKMKTEEKQNMTKSRLLEHMKV